MDFFTVVKRNRVVLPLAAAAALTMLLISESSHQNSVRTLDGLGEMAVARLNIQQLERNLIDAESGQRGYLLTHRKEYLEPYRNALASIAGTFKVLDAHYVNEPEPKELLASIHRAAEGKLSELATTIAMDDKGRAGAAAEMILSGIGNESMDTFRMLTARLLLLESQKTVAGRKDVYLLLTLNRIGVAAMTVISLLALFLFLRKRHALERHLIENQRLVQAERDLLEAEVLERTLLLTQLANHLQTAREDERSHLARNLHDELGALLTSAKLDAARMKSRLAGTAPEASKILAHLVDTLNSSIALGRRIIEDLRPSALSNLGLVATLEIMAHEFAEQTGVKVHCTLEAVTLAPSAELMVYRLVQEATTNIAKYAQASQVWISLAPRDAWVEVSVRDDGVGFDTHAKRISAHGLLGMRFRVESEGGTLTLVSAPGKGTHIRAVLPQSAPAMA